MANLLERIQDAMGDNVMTAIYEKVNELFGAGPQLFAMEFPTRPLNPKDFEYSIEDCYSRLTKPYPVQEAEFMLSDDLFDCSPMVQGPNGEKLSSVYTTIINNYVPSLESMSQFVTDQSELRQWLLSPSDTTAEDENSKESRMELCKKLYNDFLEKRNFWNKEKEERYSKAKRGEEGQDLDSYSKWLSSQGLVEEEKLNNLFNDAVVKGHYHEVLTLLGYLNVASPAETLETTKQKMRSSIRRSLDSSSDIYPVHFNPSNWFKSLTPNINPKDLTMAKDQLIIDFNTKQKRIKNLQTQLSQLTALHMPQDKIREIEEEIRIAENNVSRKEADLMGKYGKSTCNLFKTVLNIYEAVKTKEPVGTWAKKEGNKDIQTILGDSIGLLTGDVQEQFSALQKLTNSLETLNEKRMSLSETKARDMTLQRQKLEEQIKNLQADIDFLAPLVSGVITNIYTTSMTPEKKPLADSEYNKLVTAVTSAKDDKTIKEAETAFQEALLKCPVSFVEGKIKEKRKNYDDAVDIVTKSQNPTTEQERKVKDEIEKLEKDAVYKLLESTLALLQKEAADSLMTGENDGSDTDFTDIIITEKAEAKEGKISSSSSSSQKSYKAGIWFASATHSSHKTESNVSAKQKNASYSLEIGLRAKKVSIDRGGWFNPTLFKLSPNFYRLSNDIRVSKGLNKADVHTAANKVAAATKNTAGVNKKDDGGIIADERALKKLVTYENTNNNDIESIKAQSEYILPSYPMAFVIAKDITIRITSDSFEDSMEKSEMSSASSTAGGFFCFKGSSSSSSKSSSESSYSGFQGNSFYMRIPGPQILGWFLQFTPADCAMPYQAEDSEAFRVKAREGLQRQISTVDATPE